MFDLIVSGFGYGFFIALLLYFSGYSLRLVDIFTSRR